MIKKENKLIQITLDPETLELLNSLANRFHNSKTDTIKQALRVYASKKNHHYKVFLTSKNNENDKVDNFFKDDGRTLKDLTKEFEKNIKKRSKKNK